MAIEPITRQAVMTEICRILLEAEIERQRNPQNFASDTLAEQQPVMLVSNLSLREVISHIGRFGLQLEARGDGLILHASQPIPDYLRKAIKAHEPKLLRYVAAFPGQIWPTNVSQKNVNSPASSIGPGQGEEIPFN